MEFQRKLYVSQQVFHYIVGNFFRPDQWTFYLEYFKSVFTLIETNWSKPCIDADTDDTDHSKQAKDISNEQTKGKQNLMYV